MKNTRRIFKHMKDLEMIKYYLQGHTILRKNNFKIN